VSLIVGMARNQQGLGIKLGSYYSYAMTNTPGHFTDGEIQTADDALGFKPETLIMIGIVEGEPQVLDQWTKERR
jgi:hypothetical protein